MVLVARLTRIPHRRHHVVVMYCSCHRAADVGCVFDVCDAAEDWEVGGDDCLVEMISGGGDNRDNDSRKTKQQNVPAPSTVSTAGNSPAPAQKYSLYFQPHLTSTTSPSTSAFIAQSKSVRESPASQSRNPPPQNTNPRKKKKTTQK